MRNYLFFLC